MRKFFVVSVLILLAAQSSGADRFWVGGAAGIWNSTFNWSASSGGTNGVSVPVANDNVIFDNGLQINVSYDLPANDVGFAGFLVTSNTHLILTNTISATRSITINNNSGTYYTVVEAGSTLVLQSNTNTVFNFGSTALSSGRMVFNGVVYCLNQAVNTSNGPRLNAQDSIIINGLFLVGPAIPQTGSNPAGSKFRFNNNSIYELAKNGGVIPAAKWVRGSLIKITGTTSSFPSTWLGSGTYGRLEINTPGANSASIGNLSLPANAVFDGDFIVTNLGTSAGIRLATTPTTISIKGSFILNNGFVSLANSASAGSVTIEGNLIQASAGTVLDLQAGSGNTTLNIKGGLNILGTITETGSSTGSGIVLNGNLSQPMSFAPASITNDVGFQLNNASGAVVNTDWNYSGSPNSRLTLTLGNINMGANTLYLQNRNPAALTGGTASSHIIGRLRRATNAGVPYSFPVSDNAAEVANVSIVPATGPSDYTVSFSRPNANNINAVPPGVLRAGNYAWSITQNTGTGAGLNFDFGNFLNGGITNPIAMRVLHWNGASWDNLGGTYQPPGTIVVTGVTSFSPFTFGSTIDLLPVRFANVKAYQQGSQVKIDWTNLTETNIKNYTVERSTDGNLFIPIATLSATGNNNTNADYSAIDINPRDGINYYRVRATEMDGQYFLSTIVKVNTGGQKTELAIYPNPATGNVMTIQTSGLPKGEYQFSILNAAGQPVHTGSLNCPGGNLTQVVQLPTAIKAGIYSLQLINTQTKLTRTFIIQ